MHEHALSMCILQSLCPKADDQGKAWQFFLNLRIFKTVDRNYFLAKDWIRTVHLWRRKQLPTLPIIVIGVNHRCW